MEWTDEHKFIEKFEPPPIILFLFTAFAIFCDVAARSAAWRARRAQRARLAH